jgi:hypothetical protein
MIRSLYSDPAGDSERAEWAEYIGGFQEDDGLFKDPVIFGEGWYKDDPLWCGRMHLSCHVIVALTCLGSVVKKPFEAIRKYSDCDFLRSWLAGRDWVTQNISTTGNEVMNIGTLLQYARDFHNDEAAGKAVTALLEWLAGNHLNPQTGVWGNLDLSIPRMLSQAVMAAYHFWPLFTYDKITPPFIERAMDTVLATQNPNGGFGWGCHNSASPHESSACEDIDSIEPLVRFCALINYRRDDILSALKRALPWVLKNRTEDGGFVFIRGKKFVYGHPELTGEADSGAMFPTWFRTLSLAYIGQALKNSECGKYPWRFVRCPGYQFWN